MRDPAHLRRVHQRHLWMGLVLGLCAAALGVRQFFRGPRPQPKSARNAVLVFSGDTAGWLRPCGCTALQAGGLLRRGSYLALVSAEADVLYLEAGGAASGTSAYDRLKFEAIIEGETAMGLCAHNIGAAEAALGADYLRHLAAATKAPFISANFGYANGSAVVEPCRIVIAGGRRIAITGVLSPRYRTNGCRIDDPRSAILAVTASQRSNYDVLVVLAYLPEDELVELANALPEADIIMGGPTGQNMSMRRIGPVLLASATNMGKFLVRIDLPVGSDRSSWATKAIEMGPSVSDDPTQVRLLAKYAARLRDADFSSTETGLVARPAAYPALFAMADDDSCAPCHAAAYAAWKTSRHARAWQTLVAKDEHVDPACQKCHTSGYGLPGGFLSIKRSPALVNVSCQDCHGPSLAHVESQKRGDSRASPTAYAAQARYHCTHCHDRENDPDFSYEQKWPRIQHGKTPLPTSQPATRPSAHEVQP